ncbi:DUF2269 family protein [Actinospica sp.]|jgi:hypothetical protein|uniref:DUF2269 family protein n=1 Tax=Actinospica sp. TaxID=1872142 RepID=UPI002C062148|nr:DUF2269 family protein [Actinospica sp.]HWG27044.1 DUF2269 family protein [Actinospica sp.]
MQELTLPKETGRARDRVFGPRLRRGVLTVHIVASVGWIGVDLCVLVLAILGATSHDPTTQRSAFVVLGPVANVLLIPLPLLALISGIAISLGTRWKLLRHYWVVLSLLLTAIAATAVLFALRPRLVRASELARNAADPGSAVGDLGQQIVTASSIALVVLCAVNAINVYKPWGRTARGARAAAGATAKISTTSGPRQS